MADDQIRTTTSELGDRMRALAETGHPRAVELRDKAAALDAACPVNAETFDARKMLGAWARARRLWCDCTGEPLV